VREAPNDARWLESGAELPDEIRELLMVGRADRGTSAEVAELGRRLAAQLGPAAGLPGEPPESPPSDGAAGQASRPESLPAISGVRAARIRRLLGWGVGGVGALAIGVASVQTLLAPDPAPPSAPPSALTPPAPETPARALAPPAPAADSPVDPPVIVQPSVARPTEPAPSAPRSRRSPPPARAANKPDEATLLARAQAALAADPRTALALSREHQRRFPRGALAEEREVIAIDALKRLGRTSAADARAAAFERRYRGSVHQPRLERDRDTSAPEDRATPTVPP
jgi:hypothetical protein